MDSVIKFAKKGHPVVSTADFDKPGPQDSWDELRDVGSDSSEGSKFPSFEGKVIFAKG